MSKPCYAYCRVSTDRQAASGLSLRAQVESCMRYADYKGIDLGEDVIVNIGEGPFPSRRRIVIDNASAYKQDFMKRPGGKAIMNAIEDGATIIFPKLDRGFRNVFDMLGVLKLCDARGIGMHFLDLNVETNSPSGKMMVTVIGALAEWESSRRGDRVREAARQARMRNPASRLTGPPIAGFKYSRRNGEIVLKPCVESRGMAVLAYEMHCIARTVWAPYYAFRDHKVFLRDIRGCKVRFDTSYVTEHIVAEFEMRKLEAELAASGRVLTIADYEEIANLWMSRRQMNGDTRMSMRSGGVLRKLGVHPIPAIIEYPPPPPPIVPEALIQGIARRKETGVDGGYISRKVLSTRTIF